MMCSYILLRKLCECIRWIHVREETKMVLIGPSGNAKTESDFHSSTSKFSLILQTCHFFVHTFVCHQNAKRVMTIILLLPLTIPILVS